MRLFALLDPSQRFTRYAAALLALFGCYVAVLAMTAQQFSVGEVLRSAVANVLPLAVLGLAVRAVLRGWARARSLPARMGIHVGLGIIFSLLWFWLLMVMLGMFEGKNAVEFTVRPFLGPAAAWQLFQGLTLYALLAVVIHAESNEEQARLGRDENAAAAKAKGTAFRLLVKDDDEIRPVDTDRILMVRGADDYSEIITAMASHLVRMTLAEMMDRLGENFIRVHRSCLVNIDRISRAEPDGSGRMLLHMENGEIVRTSRAGSKLLRDRII